MTAFKTQELTQAVIDGIRMGSLEEGTGLDVKRYVRTVSDGNFHSCVLYLEEWNDEKSACRLRGACVGHAGGRVYETSFFTVDIEGRESRVFDFSEAEEDDHSELFNALLFECSRLYDEEDGGYRLTAVGESLIAMGQEADDEDGTIYMDEDFDGDSLDDVSGSWLINLRFNT